MDTPPTPNITSFVIRFVHTPPAARVDGQSEAEVVPCRGTIRHVQLDEEISFTHWADALAFMQRFVPIMLEPE